MPNMGHLCVVSICLCTVELCIVALPYFLCDVICDIFIYVHA